MSDIRSTLEAVRQRLNEYLRAAEPRADDWVVLSNLVDPEGKAYDGARNRLVMFVANVRTERVVDTSRESEAEDDGHHAEMTPPLYVNLQVLVLANFYDETYAEGLSLLSLAIGFFQQNPEFTPGTLPSLPPGVDRLAWEMESLDSAELSDVMALAGVPYLPSVVCRVRLPFRSDAMQA